MTSGTAGAAGEWDLGGLLRSLAGEMGFDRGDLRRGGRSRAQRGGDEQGSGERFGERRSGERRSDERGAGDRGSCGCDHDHAGHDHTGHDHAGHDHAGHDHAGHDHESRGRQSHEHGHERSHEHGHEHGRDHERGERRGGPGLFGGNPFEMPCSRGGEGGWDLGKEFGRMFGGRPGRGGPPWGRERRRPRGDVRSAVLALLAEEPMHGYQMIQQIHRRSGGSWKPSPGSVYPTLQQLQDEGLVRADEQDGRRVYELTDAGRLEATERATEFADLWRGVAPHREDSQLAELMFGVGAAFVQVAKAGNADQLAQARQVLSRTRADLYRILGENPDGDGFGTSDNEGAAHTDAAESADSDSDGEEMKED